MAADKTLFILCVFCIFVGMAASYSLSFYVAAHYADSYHFFVKQFLVGTLGIAVMWYLSQLNPDKYISAIGFGIFTVCFFIIVFMWFLPEQFVKSVGGAKRWIMLPGFSFAPVEFLKIGFVFLLARNFAKDIIPNKRTFKEELNLLLPYLIIFLIITFFIVVLQNDIGQVIVLALTFSVMALFAGTSFRFFLIALLFFVIASILIIANSEHRIVRIKGWWFFGQDFYLSFLPENIANFLRIENAPEPYQLFHSLNAIKHGGLFGEGIGDGIIKLGYLSDVHTDFVLSGIAEEIGAIGVIGITFILYLIVYRLFKIASRSQNRVYSLFTLGFAMLLVFSFLMNAYGIISITPIKGIAVPFLSYGGSSLLATCIGIGMILMISKRADLR
ncbi:MAG: FtsW/RodA/SpoVE family cell cycle protein [Campylobacteraceae bacterium]|jgi:cell division protein FtsW|nr:FtsW/RodA/SpoVE family cell cycle protein [Campylobacteraceae bacterium]